MSLAFPRSIRALNHDAGYATLVGLLVGIVLLALWGAWLVLGRIPIYETSRQWQVARDGTLVVTFTTDAIARLRPGQTARVSVEPGGDKPRQVLTATVIAVASHTTSQLEAGTARLIVSGASLKAGQSGEVQVVVQERSPWSILLDAINQRLNS
ncbi:MAG: hypothetical protein KIT87_03740 [Anaerolineae bacterium]|nr:hypothetical protein [Anaerolineae bacterium]